MIAARGLKIPASDDLLFVETWRHRDLLEDLSISGYYSADVMTRREAAEAAEQLSLDRGASPEQRGLARNVLFWHAPQLETLAPSWQARQIEFEAPRGWRAMNPSVVRYQGKIWATIRCVNYLVMPDGGYTFPGGDTGIKSRNFLVELTPAFDIARGAVEVLPDLGTAMYGGILGLEDLRPMTWRDQLRFIASTRQMNEYGRAEQVIGLLNLDGTIKEMEIIRQPWVQQDEKNWMPILGDDEDRFGEARFVYRCDPTTVVSASLVTAPASWPAPIAADNFSGSSQLIPWEDGWLCMIHEPFASPINGRRLNQHRFVQFDGDLRMVGISRRFHFQLNEEIEYVVGLAQYPEGDGLIVSYGSYDRQTWIGTISTDDVRGMLRRPLIETKTNLVRGYPAPMLTDHDRWDRLALDRDASPEERARARRELHNHIKPVEQVFSSWQGRRLTFVPPAGYTQMAPSVTRHESRLLAAQRCINYAIDEGGYYQINGHKRIGSGATIHTRTLLIELDPDTMIESVCGEITMSGLPPHSGACVQGFEDSRLFSRRGELWTISTVLDQNSEGRAEQWLARVTSSLELADAHPVYAEGLQQSREKNWMPVVDDEQLRLLYLCDPTTVLDEHGKVLLREPSLFAADHLRGGSQLVPFDNGWLAVVHWTEWIDGWPKYRHRFAWFDRDLRLQRLSPGWVFSTSKPELSLLEGYEYCTGLCQHPDEVRLVVGFQIHEREAWVGTLEAAEVLAALNINGQVIRNRSKRVLSPEVKTKFDWDVLSLDRSLRPAEREQARQELHTHIKPIPEVFPSWSAQQLRFSPPAGYAALAPHLIDHGGRLLASVRAINYTPNDDSGYRRISDGAPMGVGVIPVSRTFLLEFDPETLTDSILGEIVLPGDLGAAGGFEDLRLFEKDYHGVTDLWGIFVLLIDGVPEQWIARLGAGRVLSDARRVIPRGLPRRAEKNWLPVVGASELKFIYFSDPSTIVDMMGNVLSTHEPALAAEHFRGGSSAIPFDGGWLALVHWQTVFNAENRWVEFAYRNRFAWFDGNLVLRRVSPAFEFPIDPAVPPFPRRFQLAHGLAWHEDSERLVVGYVLYEREPWVGTVDAADVRASLTGDGMGRFDDERWVLEQTNRALQDTTAVDRASQALAVAGLPSHGGGSRAKNWDTYLAVRHCLGHCAPREAVLDVGGDRYSSFLRAMATLGYSNLTNVNIDEPRPGQESGIEYRFGDATALDFDPHSVRFALCQSVIEHGVDWRAFYREMARVLLPGGHLFVSTDFWEVPVGVEVFTPADIQEMVAYAGKQGLGLVGSLDDRCRDACVEWAGRRYTFINLLFRAS